MKQAGFVQILVIILLVAVATLGGGYLIGRSSSKNTPEPISTAVLSQPQATISPTAIPRPSPIPDETINWKALTSEKCSFSLKYPNNWAGRTEPIKPPPGAVMSGSAIAEAGFSVFCAWLYLPMSGVNYNEWGRSQSDDSYIYISKILKGGIFYFPRVTVNSLEDLIKTHSGYAYNIQDKIFSGLKGKNYEVKIEDTGYHQFYFVFERGNYIYQIDWPERVNTNYKKELELIINSIEFKD